MLDFILGLPTLAGIAWYLASMWGYSNPEKYALCTVISSIVTNIIAILMTFFGILIILFEGGFVSIQYTYTIQYIIEMS